MRSWLQVRTVSQFCSLLSTKKGRFFLEKAPALLSALKEQQDSSTEISYWQNIGNLSEHFTARLNELKQLKSFLQAKDPELRALAESDSADLEYEVDELAKGLTDAIVLPTQFDALTKCQLEITAGVGGAEAMLFTGELVSMYENLARQNGWTWSPMQLENVQLGGVRTAIIALSGDHVYRDLRFEVGVHRVQRFPLTDKTRMHTSTTCVSVLPEPEKVEAYLTSNDVKIETMRAAGPGGQNVNKRSTAVRLTHKETGIVVHCMDERFQHLNLQLGYRRLAAILMQRQQDAVAEKTFSTRKLQVGSKARAEKVRTYNFKDDRVTDHRLKMSTSNVEDFMKAGPSLASFIAGLNEIYCLEQLEEIIDSDKPNAKTNEAVS